jgi:hypothetical protein
MMNGRTVDGGVALHPGVSLLRLCRTTSTRRSANTRSGHYSNGAQAVLIALAMAEIHRRITIWGARELPVSARAARDGDTRMRLAQSYLLGGTTRPRWISGAFLNENRPTGMSRRWSTAQGDGA